MYYYFLYYYASERVFMHNNLFYGYGNGGIDEKIKLLSHPGAEILRVKLGQLALNWPYLALFGA